ncbi:MAG TPA: tetratricopeptide repeat protein, partial [Acetobacteraceae bacterium]
MVIETAGQADAVTVHRLGYLAHVTGRLAEAESRYRAAIALQPAFPEAMTNLGLVLRALGRLNESERMQRETLRLAPDFADAHNNLGLVLHDLGRLAEAEDLVRGALRLAPEHGGAWLNLGTIRQTRGASAEAEQCYRQACRFGADAAMAGSNLGLALLEQGRVEEAERCCRDAVWAKPDHAPAQVNLAMTLLLTGNYAEGWRRYEARWRVPPLSAAIPAFAAPQWDGTQILSGRTMLLWAEQGFGDVLQFCRYATALADAGARIILAVPQPLIRLLSSVSGVSQVVAVEQIAGERNVRRRESALQNKEPEHFLADTRLENAPGEVPAGTLPPFDLHCPLMGLP